MALNRHTLEMAVAAALMGTAGVTLAGAAQLDTGWGSGGPQSGYFPWRLGWLLMAVATLLLLRAWRARAAERQQPFASAEQLRRSAALFVPSALLVLAMPALGTYAPGAVYLAVMAHRHGHVRWPRAAMLGVGAMAAFYAVFELWFNVPLLKGPLEAWLGL